jgi:hypothetical protein
VIKRSELISVLSGWRDEKHLLRFDLTTPELNLSTEGVIGKVEGELLSFELRSGGFVEIRLGEGWGFDFGAPDAIRDLVIVRTVQRESGNPVKQGSFIVGRKPPSERCLLVELDESAE